MPSSAAAVIGPTLIVWWHEPQRDELPGIYSIRWIEVVDDHEGRTGLVRVSSRTADPTDRHDPAVAAELHYQLERRLGALIRVEPAIDRLELLRVERRLAVRGCRTASVAMGDWPHILGGLVVTPATATLRAVVRRDLGPNRRDRVWLWAEEQLEQLSLTELDQVDWEELGWSEHRPGSWQLLAMADRAPEP